MKTLLMTTGCQTPTGHRAVLGAHSAEWGKRTTSTQSHSVYSLSNLCRLCASYLLANLWHESHCQDREIPPLQSNQAIRLWVLLTPARPPCCSTPQLLVASVPSKCWLGSVSPAGLGQHPALQYCHILPLHSSMDLSLHWPRIWHKHSLYSCFLLVPSSTQLKVCQHQGHHSPAASDKPGHRCTATED